MRKKKNYKPFVYLALCFFCVLTLIPCVLIVITSLRTTQEIVKSGLFGNITTLHWENYLDAWEVGHFSTYFFNSVYISVFSVVGVLLLSLLGSYALARLNFPGKGIYKTLVVMGLVIPLEIIVIPLFYDMQSMNLMDTHWAIILPTIAMNVPFGTFLLSGFIKDIPASLLESARIDAVSYTHLDVYKRQTQRHGAGKCGQRVLCDSWTQCQPGGNYSVFICPVSYTHLDVYKRQIKSGDMSL